MAVPDVPTRKPRASGKPYARNPEAKAHRKTKNTPKTSAVVKPKHDRSNLTTNDWLIVRDYVDSHPEKSQAEIVKHFSQLPTGAFIFTQSSLSRNMSDKGRAALDAKVASNPNALSMKRVRVVTRPDVEKALFLWVKHMEEKGEHVTGPMLAVKRAKFEDRMDVPEAERLKSGWIANFSKAYGLKQHTRHGEAGSVDLEAVIKERERLS